MERGTPGRDRRPDALRVRPDRPRAVGFPADRLGRRAGPARRGRRRGLDGDGQGAVPLRPARRGAGLPGGGGGGRVRVHGHRAGARRPAGRLDRRPPPAAAPGRGPLGSAAVGLGTLRDGHAAGPE
ncbi:hypothetical protein SGPA1_12801 [Streptomyces misionensis JCM 4497]